MRTSDFDYELPRNLIATHPAARRDESRLLMLDRAGGATKHRQFKDLPEFIQPNDLLVMNDSRVMKARLRGIRRATGAAVEVLLLNPAQNITTANTSAWIAFCRPARKFHIGDFIDFAAGRLPARVIAEGPDGERTLEFQTDNLVQLLEKYGEIPLPPYIVQRRKETSAAPNPSSIDDATDDAKRYQTIYARQQGSVAAPTAGLHFTPELLGKIESRGARLAFITLHVGAGTFKPVEVDDPASHPMHTEHYEVPEETARLINETQNSAGRIIAVGTTTVRALESTWDHEHSRLGHGHHATNLLILPGYEFQVVDAMITNFHLPRSSLLMMISAFAGHANVMAAYQEAITQRYRFYSYGDAMLIS